MRASPPPHRGLVPDVQTQNLFCSEPTGEGGGSPEGDRVGQDGSSAVGGAMGMLSSLTSVVQTTVSVGSC